MLKEWFVLKNYSILNKRGLRLVILQLHFLLLALRKPVNNPLADLDFIENSQGQVWINFNAWLKFQLKFISPEFWASSPIIRGVTLVNLDEKYEKDVDTIPQVQQLEISEIAAMYAQTFRFIQEEEFRNWLIRNYVIFNSFSGSSRFAWDESDSLAEIGPGLGAAISLNNKSKLKRIYSLDTFEMQSIFNAVVRNSPDKYTKYSPIPVNDKRIPKPFRIYEDNLTVYAFWSFTELKLEERLEYLEVLKSAKRILIGTNEKFEGISNFEYIENLAMSLEMKFTWKSMEEVFKSELPKYQRKHRIYFLQESE